MNTYLNKEHIANCWLIFGESLEEVYFYIKKLIKYLNTNDRELIVLHDIDELKYHLLNQSLFCKQKIIVLYDTKDGNINLIRDLTQSLNNNTYLILQSAELNKYSKLRNWFEIHKMYMAVNCCKPNYTLLLSMAETILSENYILYDKQLIQDFIHLLPQNSNIVKNEIDKIILYFLNYNCNDRYLTHAIIEQLSNCYLKEAVLTNVFCDIILHKKLNLNELTNINHMLIVRSYQNFLQKIITIQLKLHSGFSIENAIKELKIALFGNYKMSFIEVINNTQLKSNIVRLKRAFELECHIKLNNDKNFLLQIFAEENLILN